MTGVLGIGGQKTVVQPSRQMGSLRRFETGEAVRNPNIYASAAVYLIMDSGYQIKEFACALCGNCCRGEGFVRVRAHEIPRIADYLKLSQEDFLETLCRSPENAEHAAEGDTWLLDQPGPLQECIFLENNRCRINAVKPEQCLGFPLKWRTPDILDYCVGMQL